MADLEIRNLTKLYGKFRAMDDVSFDARSGEFVTLLGPSGCGKSTILAAIVGLLSPDEGLIRAGGRSVFDSSRKVDLPTEARGFGLVFQSYALWPHMTVRRNVEYPLRLRKTQATHRKQMVDKILALVEMSNLAERYPHELSGGQQQRVALARTLVYSPSILLLDEPLSNLDSKLRERAKDWLSKIRDEIRLTTIYVTHDHSEALSLSDKIVVLSGGKVMQIGTPLEIYNMPNNPFVADFIGSTNFLKGNVARSNGKPDGSHVRLTGGAVIRFGPNASYAADQAVSVAVRPEKISLHQNAAISDEDLYPTEIVGVQYQGSHWSYTLKLGDDLIKVNSIDRLEGNSVLARIPSEHVRLFPADTRGA